jgi:hypothetical protein
MKARPASVRRRVGESARGRSEPARTPRAVVVMRARAEARKTVRREWRGSEAKRRVASWVLSPSSARKTDAKMVAKAEMFIGADQSVAVRRRRAARWGVRVAVWGEEESWREVRSEERR